MAGRLRLDGRQCLLGVEEQATRREGTSQRQRRGQSGAVGDRDLGKLGREVRIAGEVGRVRPADEKFGRNRRMGVEEHPHNPDGVLGRRPLALLERRRESHAQSTGA